MEIDRVKYKQKMLEVLRVFHDFCQEHDLRYSLAYGSLIGAIRHKGFIPWDDDIDVVMPRPDYDRFLKITHSRFVDGYEVISQYNRKNYYLTFAKVIDSNTTLIEYPEYSMCPIGVYIDIFAVDAVPTDQSAQKSLIDDFNRINYNAKYIIYGTQSLLHRIKRQFLKIRYGGLSGAMKAADRACSRYDYEQASLANVILDFREPVDKSIFDEYILTEFEGYSFCCVKRYDEFLKSCYDDYMTLPPVEQRVPWHRQYYLDMDRHHTINELKSMGVIKL